jgi:hypothetical protein
MYINQNSHQALMLKAGSSEILLKRASPPLIVSRVWEIASLWIGPS